MDPRRIEYMPVADLPDAPTNAKAHADAEITGSLYRFGIIEPIVIDERTGRLVSGHGRRDQLAAAKAAGRTAPDGVLVTTDGTWTVPVVRGWESQDDRDAEAAGVALNGIGPAGGWDLPSLRDSLGRLDDLEGTGFADVDLAELFAPLDDLPSADPPAPAEPPAPPAERTAQGTTTVRLELGADQAREFTALTAQLRHQLAMNDVPAVVLHALRRAAGVTE